MDHTEFESLDQMADATAAAFSQAAASTAALRSMEVSESFGV